MTRFGLAAIVVLATTNQAAANDDSWAVASRAATDGDCATVQRLADSTMKSDPELATLIDSLICIPKRRLLVEAGVGMGMADDAAGAQGRIGVGGWLAHRVALVGSLGALRDRMQNNLLVAAGELRFAVSDTLHVGASAGVVRGDDSMGAGSKTRPIATVRGAFVLSPHLAVQADVSYVPTYGVFPSLWMVTSL